MRRRNRKPNRLRGFDYASDYFYFVTMCTQNRIHYFGGIYRDVMCINKLGTIIWQQRFWLEQQYPYITIHAFIVMPNHVHAIIEINSACPRRDRSRLPAELEGPVPTADIASTPHDDQKIKSLSEIVGAFKTTTSKCIHNINFLGFQWQRSFHDRIIRNEREFNYIREYTLMNPARWDADVFY